MLLIQNQIGGSKLGAEAQNEYYGKCLAQGCWRSAGIDFASSSDHFNSHYVEKDDDEEASLYHSPHVENVQ